MGHDVGYVVWTPADFDASKKTRYPVIYFLHGMGGNEASDSAGFSGMIARGIRDGSVPPVICVFPNGGRSGYRDDVEKMIVEELIPLMDKTYPTKAEAKSRAVAGFSMGGAGAVRLSVMHPELFCAAGSWGGGMWRGADAILAAAEKGADTLRANAYAALLINGDRDRPDAFKPLAQKLGELKIPHEIVVLPDTPHNLGLYHQRSGSKMVEFLGKHLRD
jgi:endo-1,4-beta-xylanase